MYACSMAFAAVGSRFPIFMPETSFVCGAPLFALATPIAMCEGLCACVCVCVRCVGCRCPAVCHSFLCSLCVCVCIRTVAEYVCIAAVELCRSLERLYIGEYGVKSTSDVKWAPCDVAMCPISLCTPHSARAQFVTQKSFT